VDYEALYKYRFKDIDQNKRQRTWNLISNYIYNLCGEPSRTLDGACGLGEFINSINSEERWATDLGINGSSLQPDIKFQQCSILEADLPEKYFDLIFLSNVLEHLTDIFQVNEVLVQSKKYLTDKGCLVILGPNFKYCAKEYFDCADHIIPLTHISVSEHLAAAGYEVRTMFSKFLPFSFRSRLPVGETFVNLYLKTPILWRLFGKQFLIVARPTSR
jgi:hypothetical protein